MLQQQWRTTCADAPKLRRDLPHDTFIVQSADGGGAPKIAVPIDAYVADGISSVTAAGKVVQGRVSPAAIRGSELENVAVPISAVRHCRPVGLSGTEPTSEARRPTPERGRVPHE